MRPRENIKKLFCFLLVISTLGCATRQGPTPTPTTVPSKASPSPAPTHTPSSTAVPSHTPRPDGEDDLTPTPAINKGEHSYTSAASGFRYWLFIPESYGEEPQKQWPLILSLHGSSTRGTDINRVLLEALPQILTFTPDFPFIVVSPQLEEGDTLWTEDQTVQALFTLLDEVQAAYSVDPERIYLTGVSLGAGGVWGIGLRYPDRFAALVPVMGFYGPPFEVPPNICDLKNTPLWAFHGDQDQIVPPELETALVEALKACGGDAQITIYPGERHDISGKVYNDPKLYEWMLEQIRR